MTTEKDLQFRRACSKVTLQEKKEGFFFQLAETLSEDIDLSTFSKFTTDFDRVKFVAVLAWNKIGAELIYRGKKLEDAVARRIQGNKFFEKGDHQKALLCYCQSIVQAPVGPELVSVYVNRCALLQKMGEYELAITDAELAISYGAPENTRHKLYERMASCHYAMKSYHKAKVILRLAKHFSEKYDKTNTKFTQKVEKLSKSIQTAMDNQNKTSQTPSEPDNLNNLTPKFKPGKKFTSANEKFDVQHSPEFGRYAYAKKKISVGEEVLRERPYASCLSTDRMGTFCLHCFIRLKAPIGCDTCSNVAYCSRECKKQGELYHRYECRIMALLLGSGMSLNCYLALRIITQSSVDEFKKVIPDLTSTPSSVPLNANGKFEPSYQSIYNLGALETQRPTEEFLHRTIMTVFLMKCLRLVGYFEVNLFTSPFPTGDELHIGALILRNLQVVQFNAYEVCEFLMDTKSSYQKSTAHSLGLAIYSTASYFNHSCCPDVTRYFIGTTMISTAMQTVQPNQPIFDNYGPQFLKAEREERRFKLSGRYWFHCTCPACFNDWKKLDKILADIEPKDAEETTALRKLQKLDLTYFDPAVKAMELGKPHVAIEMLKKHLTEAEIILEKHKNASFYPYKTVLLAQQAIQLCYCSIGSVHYAKEKE